MTYDRALGIFNAGLDLVDGFAAGISENDYKAAAKAAKEAAEEALAINSPSKVFLRDVEDGLRRTLRIGGKRGWPYYLMSFKVVARCEGKTRVVYEGDVDPISFARATGLDLDTFSAFDHFTIRVGWPLEDRSRYHKKWRVHKKMVKRYGYPIGFYYIRVVGYELRQTCVRPEMLEGRPISAEFICG